MAYIGRSGKVRLTKKERGVFAQRKAAAVDGIPGFERLDALAQQRVISAGVAAVEAAQVQAAAMQWLYSASDGARSAWTARRRAVTEELRRLDQSIL